MDSDGSVVSLRTSAENLASSSELAPRSSKKLLSTETASTPRVRASASARTFSVLLPAATCSPAGPPARRELGAGSARRSILSCGVIGIASSCSR